MLMKAATLPFALGHCSNSLTLSGTLSSAPGAPYAPPPGVWMMSRSPTLGSILGDGLSLIVLVVPSSFLRTQNEQPRWPGPPPCMPYGWFTRRSPMTMACMSGIRNSNSRWTPLPPEWAPIPPEPSRMVNWRRRSGKRFSRT